jgi:hypothetical protein
MQCLRTACATLQENIDYQRNIISGVISSDPKVVTMNALTIKGCAAYSWGIDDTCYLKRDKSSPVDSFGTHPFVQ